MKINKVKAIAVAIAILVLGIYYYVALPAINIHSSGFWFTIILILVAIIGGKLWGLEGVLLGGIISVLIVIYGWQAYFLFSRGFKKSIWLYIYGYVKNLVVMFCCFYLTYKLMLWLSIDLSPKSWQSWILFASEIGVFQCVISLVIMSIFIPGMRFFIKRLLKI